MWGEGGKPNVYVWGHGGGGGDKKLLIMVTWGAGGVSQKFIGFALKARYALRFQTKCLYF